MDGGEARLRPVVGPLSAAAVQRCCHAQHPSAAHVAALGKLHHNGQVLGCEEDLLHRTRSGKKPPG